MAPPIVANPLQNQVAWATVAYSWTFSDDRFSDPDDDALEFQATLSNGNPLPGWLSFDGPARTFSGTPIAENVGTITIRVTAFDGTDLTGDSVSDDFTLEVRPYVAAGPVVEFEPDRPIYWYWAAVRGDAVNDPNHVAMVLERSIGKDGRQFADELCNEVLKRVDLGENLEGRLAFVLPDFGFGDYQELYANGSHQDPVFFGNTTALWRTDEDGTVAGIPSGGDPALNRGWVPFYASGIAKCSAWMTAFIGRYLERQTADDRIPQPTAFWMDTENEIFINEKWTRQWSLCKSDPRWSTEVVSRDGRTWSEIVADESIPDPAVPGGTAFVAGNVDHSLAVFRWMHEGMKYAWQEGFARHVEAQWPDCLHSNWLTTWDGPRYLGFETFPDNPETFESPGTHQAPVLYGRTGLQINEAYGFEIRPGLYSGRPYSPWIYFAKAQISSIDGATIPALDEIPGILEQVMTRTYRDGVRHLLVWGDPNPVVGGISSEATWDVWYPATQAAEANVAQPTNDSNTFILLGN